ncbi:MAG: hypothetical protein U9Q74_03125 [Gemmatimonadota bacterium]|nr:hypothetical protein [Gemmatimonadota bacterium]
MRAVRWTATATAALVLVASVAMAQEATTLGGYGEVHYQNKSGPNTPGEVNLARFVVFLSHTFNDRLAFRSELEVEDAKVAGGSPGGEVALEQAYIDYRLGSRATLRTGLVLVPVGIINETHEPTTFHGVARPAVDHDVIPATWRELGVGLTGTLGAGLNYRLYLVNGLLASGFTASEGIRDGRQEGREATFANPSLTGRLEYARPGLKVGASFFSGGTAGGDSLVGTGWYDAPVTVLAADARYDNGPLALRGVVATASLPDAASINRVYGHDVGRRIAGGYVEAAYDLLSLAQHSGPERLIGFARYEHFDTQASVDRGVVRDADNARRHVTVGLSFLPIANVVFKGDLQFRRTDGPASSLQVASLGVGYWF